MAQTLRVLVAGALATCPCVTLAAVAGEATAASKDTASGEAFELAQSHGTPEVQWSGRKGRVCQWMPWLCDTAPAPAPRWVPWEPPAPAPVDAKKRSGICAIIPSFCPTPSLPPSTPAPSGRPPRTSLPDNALLHQASQAPLQEFYMYRVQGDEDYPQPNHNLANLAGALWYLHNEIVWHKEGRYGTYFSSPVTRILKFRVQTRATQPLFDLGMNFGVMNTFDSGECTGPWACDNLIKSGHAVGCETWVAGAASNFPHQQWNHLNHYQGAVWYSLPGSCPSQRYTNKTEACQRRAPGGLCAPGVEPTGTWDCTYRLQQVGEITINELEGIADYEDFIRKGGREYDPETDKGVHTAFWDKLQSKGACAWRVRQAEKKFHEKYPKQQALPEPICDFNRHKFYSDRST